MLDNTDKEMLKEISNVDNIKNSAHSLRKNGEGISINSTENIIIAKKSDKEGIDITIKPNTLNEKVHIPVIIGSEGIEDKVYNTFLIGENSDVTILAGCGIHNCGDVKSKHDGVHEFRVKSNSRMKYIEKHIALGDVNSIKEFNPETIIYGEKGSYIEIDMSQMGGVTLTNRKTKVVLEDDARLVIVERILTENNDKAYSSIDIELRGENSSAQIVSRSVAKDDSIQDFKFNMSGYKKCRGHIECDAIIMDNSRAIASPAIAAYSSDANLIHEAAIGKIESEQITKLMALGLTKNEAEDVILKGFLK